MSTKYPIVSLLFVLLFAVQANAQSFLSANGKAIVNEEGDTIILRGMGLGGWMVQEGYMMQTSAFAGPQHEIRGIIEDLIGEEDTDLFYEAWLENNIQKVDIDSLKSWGFNSVRLPMHYNLYTLPIEEEPVAGENTWLTKGFELTDSLIAWCAANEMYVILDLHAAPGGQGYAAEISDYDEDKPSLWESPANQAKMVALWRNLAERYVNEKWVGAYDILNEPNWDLPGGTALRNLYGQVTDAIREVDNNHLLIIEGNWFANDFTGLTPPWDDNMAYGPHKYWSYNEPADIQWVTDIRDQYNVPLYFGESGENSNVWFRDAIRLIEGEGIGWAWWPMKKIESIAGPLSVIKTDDYQTLLNYWSNGGPQPSAAFAKNTMMAIANAYKMENCFYQKDVIDAMFRQIQSDDAKPYNTQTIPGIVYAADYDMGANGIAYFDTDLATYHVSTGSFSAWNKGWAYRNDGVDVEKCQDNTDSNGFNVGWIDEGEWLQYDIDVQNDAVYEVEIRFATAGFDGRFRLNADGSDLTGTRYVPNTGGYQSWETAVNFNVILSTEDKKLRFYSEGSDYNMSSLKFTEVAPINSVDTEFLSAHTLDRNTVQLNINKPLASPLMGTLDDFEIFVGGTSIPITSMAQSADNMRIITFDVDFNIKYGDLINITYTGDDIEAQDGTTLQTFDYREVENRLPIVTNIPGRLEAEDFFFQSGIALENTFDVGGGKNIGFLDAGDYIDYYINVTSQGVYQVLYRSAAPEETGSIELQIIDANGGVSSLQNTSLSPTGDWQAWETTNSSTVHLTLGVHQVRVLITGGGFNLNWLEFDQISDSEEVPTITGLSVFPNPTDGLFNIRGNLAEAQDVAIQVYDVLGRKVFAKELENSSLMNTAIDLSALPKGTYHLVLQTENGQVFSRKVLRIE